MFHRRSRGEHPSIARRRAVEDHLATQQNNLAVEQKARVHVNWNATSALGVKKNALKNVARGQRILAEQNLLQRKEKLKALFAQEDEGFRGELSQLQETSSQRSDRMLDRARQLKQRRIDETKAIAQAAYHRQWKEGCDDLRTQNSTAFRLHCHDAISKQISDKRNLKATLKVKDKEYAVIADRTQKELIAKDKREEHERKMAIHDNRNALLAQMADSRQRRQHQANQLQAERRALAEQAVRDAEDARQFALAEVQRKRDLNNKTKEFNAAELQRKKEALMRKQAEDKRLLDLNAALFAKEVAAQADDKAGKQADMRNFRQFLADQKEKERLVNIEIERRCQAELDAVNNKRDAFMQRQQDARRKLHEDVYEGRRRQIAEKQRLKNLAREQTLIDRKGLQMLMKDEKKFEEDEDAREREKGLLHRQDLDKQIQQTRMKKNLHHAKKQLDKELADASEAQYRAFLDREQAKKRGYVQPNFGLKTAFVPGGWA